ncbi:hypothetical protein Naga_100036g19 [Nannochloropsis gaditana]|uniref:Uncharacterized protein n=1 Tax=Nannochloropsis gaditana TaxID=72520 RepID=W7TLZ7_9STRA|nr:hypothetical protein Naga_100036g19 [Nannochloropsis gaditana]
MCRSNGPALMRRWTQGGWLAVCPFLPRARETSRHELCIVRVPAMLGRGSSGEHPEGSVTRQWEGEWPLGNRSRFALRPRTFK